MEALAGLDPGEFGSTYEAWLATLHPDEVDGILAKVQAAIDVLGSYHFEHRALWPDGTSRWIDCRGQVTSDEDGNFTGTIGCAVDVTDRHRTEAASVAAFERERRLRDRLEFLVKVTDTALAATDHLSFMRDVAAAAVPKLGDWCSIHFQPEPFAPFEVVVAHADPARIEWAEALARRFPYNPDGDRGIPLVMRTGRTDFIEEVTSDVIDTALERGTYDPAEIRPVLDALGISSSITVPLATSRGVVGAMQFIVTAESGRVYEHEDVRLAEISASRIADALDNKWLAGQHRRISATLQRSLLPPKMPEIDGIDLAVRYWPAGSAIEAGGDFYDIFATSESSWSLLIGDVCGTGPDAAALTGITRHTVRAAARHGQDHDAVLEWLNQAMRLSNRDRFCTAVYATLTTDPAHGWRFSSCAAGHPRPIIIRADGRAELLGLHGTLLGVFEEIDIAVADTTLEVGDTVVLYTDGITDLRPPHARTELELTELVAKLVDGRSAGEVADAIHDVITDELASDDDRGDDIALLVFRVTDPLPAA
jgi:serine phosphatase RsbU (regulator of sigma subunit)